MEQIHLENSFEQWVKNFGLNLANIWKERSARNLVPGKSNRVVNNSAIVIGAGPSLYQHEHLKLLAKSDFKGCIICTDRILVSALKAGITPNKFPKFYVATIDTAEKIKFFYEHDLVKKHGSFLDFFFVLKLVFIN